jgi:hypothetical protein
MVRDGVPARLARRGSMRSWFLALCAVLILCGGEVRAETAREAIEAANTMFQDAFNRGDAAAVAQLYTPDAAVLPPDAPRADGREAIQRFWRDAIDGGLRDLSLQSAEMRSEEDRQHGL